MRRVLNLASAASLFLVLGLPAALGAQDMARAYMIDGKPGFETALEKHMEMRRSAGDPWEWTVLEVVNGEKMGWYVIRSGGHGWTDFDAYEEELDPSVGLHFRAEMSPVIERGHSTISRTDTAHSRYPDDWSEIEFVQVVSFDVKPGHGDELDEAISRYHAAIVDSDLDIRYAWDHNVNGAGGARTLAIFRKDWSDFRPRSPGMRRVMTERYGEEEAARIEEQWDGAIRGSESMVLRIRPDLSLWQEE